MVNINENYLKLKAGYLFPEITKRVNTFLDSNPKNELIKLGIGDVTEPLPEACIKAMMNAVEDMGCRQKFKGYGPEQGYSWLREKIAYHDFQLRGCDIDSSEIFISDGSKCDTGNILDIFGKNNKIAITDPVYPVYVDTNVMSGNTGYINAENRYDDLIYLPIKEENNFVAQIPDIKVDLIYLCFPNNPTGAVATKDYLKSWVDYARFNNSIILFDAAYEAFITDESLPHSIYEIEGAKDCAIEFRSFSKNAGFTGTRCAFTVVPKTLMANTANNSKIKIWDMWNRRQSTKFNGVSYIIQRGAEAVYSEEGKKQVDCLVRFYLENAKIIREQLGTTKLNQVYGGIHSPYIWLKTPGGMSSWEFFDELLQKVNIVGTPGSGFGSSGEGYFRISAFNSRENIEKAMKRIKKYYQI
ncbi:LL-diaminopimelate aminotransferase [Candidatus Atelocyanobacterium thalassae]|jgi:LL-diaminopimelate aminotransferase|uniref:LL-diaminopimelate aminotransferase n=1 Tax=Atelocyanobacterium thalassa (isolate ALOHA) TaxID=1453429 RepID=D3EQB9_ATETH|nr:LL-diaminopimelate aminotransferase [Candidatus Atelocyanobacterium thalassa]ADB95669.1 LL-diaminopimelate aminotransferase apoenzyme [Candidatus Atelocyanobacterium thalassa isolate ALOHA]MCH2543110.1 LL-diaminopimelate aminotransferase [Candidatus Atelocyanobacterium sp. ALOHA_A2.5_9]|tara:strand:- start:97408 stop:98646 length:1239 start_codon:yes stop_codon:yes gene_type:complete